MKSWGTSDKIAIIASIAGLLQVAALIVTVVIMIRNGRRQLEAYVLPENAGVFDGTMLDPPQPQFKDVPGVVILDQRTLDKLLRIEWPVEPQSPRY